MIALQGTFDQVLGFLVAKLNQSLRLKLEYNARDIILSGWKTS